MKEWEKKKRLLYQSNIEYSGTVVTYNNVYNFSGLSIRFCVIPMDSTSAILQCLVFPASVDRLKDILNRQNTLGGQIVAMESAGVPCIRLPISELPGITMVLGVIEDPKANWGMGLVPPLIAAGSAAPSPPLPGREDMEREMIAHLRSVSLPNVKNLADLSSMLASHNMAWEDYDEPAMPALWEEYSGTRHRDSGENLVVVIVMVSSEIIIMPAQPDRFWLRLPNTVGLRVCITTLTPSSRGWHRGCRRRW